MDNLNESIMQSGLCGHHNLSFVSLTCHYLHYLLGSPYENIKELPIMIPPIELAGALPSNNLKRKYNQHNQHVIVSLF